MSVRQKRLAISIDDDLSELLEVLAKFEGKPKSTLVADILHQMKPHFKDLITAMELVEQKKTLQRSLIGCLLISKNNS